MNIQNYGILDAIPGDPNGYVTKDLMWAAIPIAGNKNFGIVHNGNIVHIAKNYKSAKNYILKESKKKKTK